MGSCFEVLMIQGKRIAEAIDVDVLVARSEIRERTIESDFTGKGVNCLVGVRDNVISVKRRGWALMLNLRIVSI